MNNFWLRVFSGFIYIIVLFIGTTSYKDCLVSYFSDYYFFISQKSLFYGLILVLFIATFLETSWFLHYDNLYFILISISITCVPFYMFSKNYFDESFYYSSELYEVIKNLCFIIMFIISCIAVFIFPEKLSMNISKLFFLCAYIGVPFSLVLIIPIMDTPTKHFSPTVFFIFLLIWMSDTFSYLIGRFCGKRKLAPKISPKKTYAGLIGGMLFTILTGFILDKYLIYSKFNWIVLGILISVFAPIGDLVASKLKREFEVKDSGFLIPGHGGLLDRLDSFIMCIPFIFLYRLLISLIPK